MSQTPQEPPSAVDTVPCSHFSINRGSGSNKPWLISPIGSNNTYIILPAPVGGFDILKVRDGSQVAYLFATLHPHKDHPEDPIKFRDVWFVDQPEGTGKPEGEWLKNDDNQ